MWVVTSSAPPKETRLAPPDALSTLGQKLCGTAASQSPRSTAAGVAINRMIAGSNKNPPGRQAQGEERSDLAVRSLSDFDQHPALVGSNRLVASGQIAKTGATADVKIRRASNSRQLIKDGN